MKYLLLEERVEEGIVFKNEGLNISNHHYLAIDEKGRFHIVVDIFGIYMSLNCPCKVSVLKPLEVIRE